MYQSSTPYGQDPYRGSPVAGPMRTPYTGGQGYNPAMQYQQQQQQRYTSPPQPQPPAGGFRQTQSTMPQQQYMQQQAYQAQGYSQSQPRGDGRPYKGTLPPGQMVRVGQHAVRVERYLSEGGYAHVYLTSSDKPIYPPKRSAAKGRWGEKGYTTHCLKRIAFEDESVWRDVSREIEVMKALPPSPHLIQYLESSHHRLPNGTHEVFILMEFCSGGGIIDLLNKRLRDRLKEIEILNIFTDVCEAVAAMHAMSRPLLHRDLKIENVLSHPNGQPPTPQRPTPLVFKLCDFGSTTFPATHPPQNKAEADALAMDLNKHTTLQYRSPEMVEPMLGWAVGLPSDVWALGVLLYKLCYYTTPFEEHGTLAIVNAKYTFPQYPVYSPRLQHLIASMLVEHPSRRPSVFEVLRVVHDMSGTRPEVDYPMPNRQLPATLPPSPKKSKSPTNVLDFTSGSPSPTNMPTQQPSLASSVQPQRRGRPTRPESMKATPQPQQQQQPEPVPLPKMPVPASSTGPAKPTKIQVTGDGAAPDQGAKLQHSISLSRRTVSGTKPVLARLQGSAFDGSSASLSPSSQTTTRQGSVDAFGVAKNQSAASPGGFGDSFNAPLPPPKDGSPKTATFRTGSTDTKRTGSSDAFGVPAPTRTGSGDAFGMSSRFTGQKVMSPTGFGDSFSSGFSMPSGGPVRPPPPTLPKAARGFTDSFTGPPAKASPVSPPSPQKPTRTSSSSTQSRSPGQGNMSFEQRFPSIESLTGGSEKSSPMPSPPVQSPPAQSPKTLHRASISMANLTGPQSKFAPASRLSASPQPPHPRSTHVTGTAFKRESLKPPPPTNDADSTSPTADYLNLLDDEVGRPQPKSPEDLFGGNDESLAVALAPLQPSTSNTSSGSRFGVSPGQPAAFRAPPPTLPKPQTTPGRPLGASQRATLPDLSVQRPTTNFNSANWSPLQTMKAPSPANGASADVDSSDDEAVPENVDGKVRRPISPVKSSSPHPPSPGIARRMAAYQQQATTGPSASPPKQGYGTWSGRGSAPRGARPQSMFDPGRESRTGSAGTLSPPLVSVRSGSPGSGGSRTPDSTHGRRSSINDIVSRYEALNAPSAKENVANGGNRGGIFGKPAPAVASKPPGLGARRPSGPRVQSVQSVPRPAVQPKPEGISASGDKGREQEDKEGDKDKDAKAKPVPAPKPKPALAPKPKPADTGAKPSSPVSPTTNTSTLPRKMSKPELAPKPKPQPKRAETLPVPLEERRNSSGSAGSRSSSPEKQQPVNLLIQRWNKGELKR